MKKIFTLLLTLILTLSLVACSSKQNIFTDEDLYDMVDYYNIYTEEKIARFHKIDAIKLKSLLEQKASFMIVIGYPGCSWCQKGAVPLNQWMLKNDADIFYLDISEEPDEGFNTVMDLVASHMEEKYGSPELYTPAYLAVKKGVITDSFVGGISSTGSEYTEAEANELMAHFDELYKIVK